MGLLVKLSALAVRQVLTTVGLSERGVDAVSNFLEERFINHSTRLSVALQRATERAWEVLEFALASESLLDRLKPQDDQAFRQQVQRRAFRDPAATPGDDRPGLPRPLPPRIAQGPEGGSP